MAAAGPAANIFIALVFAILVRSADFLQLSATFIDLAVGIIVLNIFLALFNLVPIPPLDGSKILPKLLPYGLALKYGRLRQLMEQNMALSFTVVIVTFVLFLGPPLYFLTKICHILNWRLGSLILVAKKLFIVL